jgi:hypothetical protein
MIKPIQKRACCMCEIRLADCEVKEHFKIAHHDLEPRVRSIAEPILSWKSLQEKPHYRKPKKKENGLQTVKTIVN